MHLEQKSTLNMKTLKLAFLAFVCLTLSQRSFSQYYYYDNGYYDNDIVYSVEAGLGFMNCITDVGGPNSDKGIYINELRGKNYKFSFNVAMEAMYQNFIGLRLQGTWGSVRAADADITSTASGNLVSKRYRNLAFRSNITEIALLAEFHPLQLLYYEGGPPAFSPYLVAGVGFFSFNPQASVGDRTVNLATLHTEGQGFPEFRDRNPYRLAQANVPLGIGVRYEISPLWNVKLEYLHRVLFTDYLDDASNRKYVDPQLFAKYLPADKAIYAKALADPRLPVPPDVLEKFRDPITKQLPVGNLQPARRGNPDDNDSYMTISVKVGFIIGRQQRPW